MLLLSVMVWRYGASLVLLLVHLTTESRYICDTNMQLGAN